MRTAAGISPTSTSSAAAAGTDARRWICASCRRLPVLLLFGHRRAGRRRVLPDRRRRGAGGALRVQSDRRRVRVGRLRQLRGRLQPAHASRHPRQPASTSAAPSPPTPAVAAAAAAPWHGSRDRVHQSFRYSTQITW